MEIIHVVLGKVTPSRMTGVNKVVHELATRQHQGGEPVSLWGITKYPKHNYQDRVYPTRLFRARRNPFRVHRTLLAALDELLREPRTVVFHLHGGMIPVFYALSKALRERGIPYVFTPHSAYQVMATNRGDRRKKWYFRRYERKLLEGARMIHCLGKREVCELRSIYPNDKTRLIPYGFESGKMMPPPDPQRSYIIGFSGRFDIHSKGLDVLLRSFALLAPHIPKAELRLIGDSAERPDLEKLARQLGIADKTTFWGTRFGEEKLSLLREFHVFAHPSRNEGLPTAVLEAAALGIPCVITEATNLGDPVRRYRAGEVIATAEPLPLAEALWRVYNAQHAGATGWLQAAAQRMIREEFDWGAIVRDFHLLYKPAC